MIFYLKMPVETLLKRIISSSGLNYYESGRDIGLSTDFYESFKLYQRKIIAEYTKMEQEFDFVTIEGTLKIENIQNKLRLRLNDLLKTGVLG